jgi:histidinol-phosphate aminotransferase
MLLASRGSDEAIDLLIRAFCRASQDAVLICPPTFGMYAVAAQIQGATVLQVPLQREAGYGFDPAGLLRVAGDSAVKLVFLCSPNNPTGNRLDATAVLELARGLEGRALVVVDEAYVEFAAQPSLCTQLAERPGLVVLRTLSKAYGLAGARCGVLIGHPDVVALLRKVIQPYAVTQLTIEAVFRALQPAALEQAHGHVGTLIGERTRLAAALSHSAGVLRSGRAMPTFCWWNLRIPKQHCSARMRRACWCATCAAHSACRRRCVSASAARRRTSACWRACDDCPD